MNEPEEEPRERFWQGLLAGLLLSSTLVGGLVALWARLRSSPTAAPAEERREPE